MQHEELIHKDGDPYVSIFHCLFLQLNSVSILILIHFVQSWQKVDINTSTFTPDITPLILAAHKNNYEILKILLDRGATVPTPHDIRLI